MCRILSILVFVLISGSGTAQTVRFRITSLPANHVPGSPVYLAGAFNGWNPKDEKARFISDSGGYYRLDIRMNPGKQEYKLTGGSWERVETGKGGAMRPNRVLDLQSDTTIYLQVEAWQGPGLQSRPSTASPRVSILDTAFFIPQLNRYRRIWVYLPASYDQQKKFPVLYMQDGQNLFDDSSSFSGEWGVDECLDSLHDPQVIIVGIDNGGSKRLNEYAPYDMEKYGKAEGDAYLAFIVRTLKPCIDKKYRTVRGPRGNGMAGSSMGGLISYYALLRYPKVFGFAGVFSPSFWIAPDIFGDTGKKGKKQKGRIFFYAGKQEGESMVPLTLKAFMAMQSVSKAVMTLQIRDDGKHNEAAWRRILPDFFRWILN